MNYILNKISQFKELKLIWFIKRGLLKNYLRKVSKFIINKRAFAAISMFGINCVIIICVLAFVSSKSSKKDEPDKTIINSMVQEAIVTATYPLSVSDTTDLSCSFLEGNWNVVSTDSLVQTRVKFECLSEHKVFLKTDYNFPHLQVIDYDLSNFESRGSNYVSRLHLTRYGKHMKAVLKTVTEAGVQNGKEMVIIKTREFYFTKTY